MTRRAAADPARAHVAIVAVNAETRGDLVRYLREAGVDARADKSLKVPPTCEVAVVFPDEYETRVVVRELARLRKQRPGLRVVIVTRDPRAFEDAGASSHREPAIVIPKPAWGWKILDAVRGQQR